jgi:hypothetical protein
MGWILLIPGEMFNVSMLNAQCSLGQPYVKGSTEFARKAEHVLDATRADFLTKKMARP